MQLAKVPPKAPTDFSIDAAHELALFIWNVDQSLKLKSVPYFCKSYGPNCSIYARHETIYCVRTFYDCYEERNGKIRNNFVFFFIHPTRAIPLVSIKFYLLLRHARNTTTSDCQ